MNALLDKLKDLFSKSFVVSSFLPVVVCAAVNALLLYETNPSFRAFARSQQPKGGVDAVLQGGSAIFVLAVLAGLLSPSITFFRELLEGNHWLAIFDPIRTQMIGEHAAELRRCEEYILKAQDWRTQFDRPDANNLRPAERWIADLQAKAALGVAANGAYTAPAGGDLNAVLDQQLRNEVVLVDQLEKAEVALAKELSASNANTTPALNDRWDRFLQLIGQYATQRLDLEIIEKTALRRREWGQTEVAPTRLGNLANASASYGLLCYGFSLDSGWSRLQKVLQKDQEHFGALQDVKASLDSVIMLFWLIAPTTAVWSLYLVTQLSLGLFLIVSIGGAIACNLLYRTAISSYVAFADLVRSSVDLYRLDLFPALHLPTPAGLVEERDMWGRLRRLTEFGEVPDLRYESPKK